MDDSETIEFYSDNVTHVFWNMDDYPVPVDTDLGSVYSNIERALYLMGFEGILHVCVDCKKLKYDQDKLFRTGRIGYLRNWGEFDPKTGDVRPSSLDMSFYMLVMSADTAPRHANVAVITSAEPDSEIVRVMRCLKSRGHNVLRIDPPADDLFSVDSLLNHSRLLDGGKPRSKQELTPADLRRVYDWECTDDDDDDDVGILSNTKMLDFSERVRPIKGDRTFIFWDAMDCPFPLSFPPNEVYEKIKSFLWERGFSDNIIIWAYVDGYKNRDTYLGDKNWDSRIYFLPGGDESSRRIRMLNDIYLLSRDSPLRSHEGTMILVSDHFKCDPDYFKKFRCINNRNYYLFLRVPRGRKNIPDSPDEWLRSILDRRGTLALAPSEHSNTRSEIPDELPRSLLDGPRTLGSEISESSEGPLPKKPKLDADYETPSQG